MSLPRYDKSSLAMKREVVTAGDTVYAAGQIAADSRGGVAPAARQDPAFPYYGSDIQKQARYILGNLRSVFKAAGCDLKDVVKSQVFLTDLRDFYYSDQRKQTRYVLNNIRSVLRAAGCDLKDVVKSQVFVTDLDDSPSFDEAWKEFFPSPPPRTTVQVSGLLVPGCRIEIDLTAVLPGVARRGMDSEAVLAGETLYAAGQIAADSRGGSDIRKQTRYVLDKLGTGLDRKSVG